jgi:4-amino-4-deoxy-L-arabinose transferase-like glycosyltransferase
LLVLLSIAIISIAAGLGRPTLWEPDEPRFAEATRQMFARGDFITPYFNGVPRFEKPILLYWLQALAFTVFGDTEFAARLPAALAGIGAVIVLYLLAARIASRPAALVAAMALATMFRFVTYARQGVTDIPALFFIVSALDGFERASDTSGHRSAALLVAWSSVGLGVLTKGPVGLLPVIIWGCYAAVRRDWTLISRIRPWFGLLVASLIGMPWHVAMIVQHGRGFVDFAIGHEMVARVLSEESFAPERGWTYYLKVFPGDAAPWSLLFVAAVAWAALRWRALDARTRQAIVFGGTWFGTVIVVFTLSQSKLPHYILPAYPAAALMIGVFVERVTASLEDAKFWRVPVAATCAAVLAAAVLTALFLATPQTQTAAPARWLLPLVLVAGAAALAYATWSRSALPAASALTWTMATAYGVVGLLVIPRVVEPFKPMPILAREADRIAPRHTAVGLMGRYGASSLIYYSRHNVQWLDDDSTAVSYLTTGKHAVAVMPLTDYERLRSQLHGLRAVATAEEFNVRIERLLERKKTPGRMWVLVIPH